MKKAKKKKNGNGYKGKNSQCSLRSELSRRSPRERRGELDSHLPVRISLATAVLSPSFIL